MPLPARGTSILQEGTAASAFSRGDLLTGAPSALSRMPVAFGADITGIALCDSTDSVNALVTYAIPAADEAFYCDVAAGSALTAGSSVSFVYSASSTWQAVSSTTVAPRGVVLKGVSEVNQSGASRVLVRFIGHDGNLLFS